MQHTLSTYFFHIIFCIYQLIWKAACVLSFSTLQPTQVTFLQLTQPCRSQQSWASSGRISVYSQHPQGLSSYAFMPHLQVSVDSLCLIFHIKCLERKAAQREKNCIPWLLLSHQKIWIPSKCLQALGIHLQVRAFFYDGAERSGGKIS